MAPRRLHARGGRRPLHLPRRRAVDAQRAAGTRHWRRQEALRLRGRRLGGRHVQRQAQQHPLRGRHRAGAAARRHPRPDHGALQLCAHQVPLLDLRLRPRGLRPDARLLRQRQGRTGRAGPVPVHGRRERAVRLHRHALLRPQVQERQLGRDDDTRRADADLGVRLPHRSLRRHRLLQRRAVRPARGRGQVVLLRSDGRADRGAAAGAHQAVLRLRL